MNFEIVTDSCANLSEELIRNHSIKVLSLSFLADKEYPAYEEGKVTDLSVFYRMMREKKEIRTSLVNREVAEAFFDSLLAEGKNVLYIGFSSALSGTYQNVSVALEAAGKKYPSCKTKSMDTYSAALGEGLLVYYAARMREQGCTMDEVYDWLSEYRFHMCHWLIVDDLFFLKRGGRIPAALALFGTALDIKPVLSLNCQGALVPKEKVRGRKKALQRLVMQMKETMSQQPGSRIVAISHGDCKEDAEALAEQIEQVVHPEEIIIRILDPVIGAHAGPGAIAVFYFGRRE